MSKFLIPVFLICSSIAFAQTSLEDPARTAHNLAGKVVDPNDVPIIGAKVELSACNLKGEPTDGIVRVVSSDQHGNFDIGPWDKSMRTCLSVSAPKYRRDGFEVKRGKKPATLTVMLTVAM